MAKVTYMVRAATKAACQYELDRMCDLLGARPATLPTDAAGTGWVARAVPDTKTPTADGGRGLRVQG